MDLVPTPLAQVASQLARLTTIIEQQILENRQNTNLIVSSLTNLGDTITGASHPNSAPTNLPRLTDTKLGKEVDRMLAANYLSDPLNMGSKASIRQNILGELQKQCHVAPDQETIIKKKAKNVCS